jgi:hypothetical protein
VLFLFGISHFSDRNYVREAYDCHDFHVTPA